LSDAVAATVIVPETVAPEAGALIETTGGVVFDCWLLELELTNPLHPEFIRAKTATSKYPTRVITCVPVTHLRISIIEILVVAFVNFAERPRKHTCHRFLLTPH
jgi:hypothetical protein